MITENLFGLPRLVWGVLIPLTLVAAVGCSAPPPEPTPEPTIAPEAGQLNAGLATSDFGVGSNRLVFALIDSASGPLTNANVSVSTFRLTDAGQEGPIETTSAVFRQWPVGARGAYTTRVNFDQAGTWGIGVTVTNDDGSTRPASFRIDVKDSASTPAIGDEVPHSITKIADDVESLDQLTSDTDPDSDLYAMTVADALGNDLPLVLLFSTPAYCVTATCGPQLDVVKALKDEYGDRANFIHVEVYDNPHEIQGDLTKGILAPALTEWGLPSEPWTFVVGGDGLLNAKFESFTTRDEIESALTDAF